MATTECEAPDRCDYCRGRIGRGHRSVFGTPPSQPIAASRRSSKIPTAMMFSRLVQSGCRRYGLSIMTVETRATDSYIKTISMKAYLITTGIVFGLITVAHVWRV